MKIFFKYRSPWISRIFFVSNSGEEIFSLLSRNLIRVSLARGMGCLSLVNVWKFSLILYFKDFGWPYLWISLLVAILEWKLFKMEAILPLFSNSILYAAKRLSILYSEGMCIILTAYSITFPVLVCESAIMTLLSFLSGTAMILTTPRYMPLHDFHLSSTSL